MCVTAKTNPNFDSSQVIALTLDIHTACLVCLPYAKFHDNRISKRHWQQGISRVSHADCSPAIHPILLFNPGLVCVLYFSRTFVPPFRQQIAVQIAIRRFVLHASTPMDGDTDTAMDEQCQCQGKPQRPAGIDQCGRPDQTRPDHTRLG